MIGRPLASLATIALSLACSTCCQSVFLTVTRGDPGVMPTLPEPVIAREPYVLPATIENRFDTINNTLSETDLAAFAAFDSNAQLGHRVSSLAARDAIEHKLGEPGLPPSTGLADVDACLVCEASGCDALFLTAWPGERFKTDDHPIVTLGSESVPVMGIEQLSDEDRDAMHADEDFQACVPASGNPIFLHFKHSFSATKGPVRIRLEPWQVATPILSFIHTSDIQIRDPDIRLGDRVLSKHLDKIISSMEYDHDLEVYNRYLTKALFSTINAIVRTSPVNLRPALLIHTGDAIDSGVKSELREFHTMFDTLNLPAYDVLGNHDVLAFGNMLPTVDKTDATCGTAKSVLTAEFPATKPYERLLPNKLCISQQIECPKCAKGEAVLVAGPTHELSHQNFMAEFKRHELSDPVQQPPRYWEGKREYCEAMTEGGVEVESAILTQGETFQHGFDLNHASGYYAFAWDITIPGDENKDARHALFIALDTNDLDESEIGNGARVGKKQLAWLRHTLACVEHQHADDLVFVFGHHGLDDVQLPAEEKGVRFEKILAASKNVVGYFYGHNHHHDICGVHGRCDDFWEVMTSSVIEFPQEARMVRIEYVGSGLGFIEVTAFAERLESDVDEIGRAVARARAGAERDMCGDHPDACDSQGHVIRTDGRQTNGRLFFQLPKYKRLHPLQRKR